MARSEGPRAPKPKPPVPVFLYLSRTISEQKAKVKIRFLHFAYSLDRRGLVHFAGRFCFLFRTKFRRTHEPNSATGLACRKEPGARTSRQGTETLSKSKCRGIFLLTVYRCARTLISSFDRSFVLSSGESTTLLQGTLDLLILKSLATGEMHGLGVSRRIEQITGGTFVVKPGSLFPALHRMEEEGWISSFWGDSENNRRAKYYRLTKPGRLQLEAETKRWSRISLAIARVLEAS